LRRGDEHIAKHRGIERPRNIWKRDLEKEMDPAGFKYNWKMETTTQDGA